MGRFLNFVTFATLCGKELLKCLFGEMSLYEYDSGNEINNNCVEQTKAPHFRHGVGGEEPYFMLLFQKSVVVTVCFEVILVILLLYDILRDEN